MRKQNARQENTTYQFAHDLEMFSDSISVGLSVEDAAGFLSENGSTSFSSAWYALWLRLQNGLPLALALQDIKRICADRRVDHFCELVMVSDTYRASALPACVERHSSFLNSYGQAEFEATQRIKSVSGVAWLALFSPWIMLMILMAKPENAAAYLSPEGLLIILSGVLLSLVAGLFSRRIAAIPELDRPFS